MKNGPWFLIKMSKTRHDILPQIYRAKALVKMSLDHFYHNAAKRAKTVPSFFKNAQKTRAIFVLAGFGRGEGGGEGGGGVSGFLSRVGEGWGVGFLCFWRKNSAA